MLSCDLLLNFVPTTPMSFFRKLIFSDLFINFIAVTQNSDGESGEVEIYQLCGRLVQMFPLKTLRVHHHRP